MSKAEKFVQEYTRNCSNEIIVPTQDGNSYTKGYTHWLTPDQARRAVEIAREEIYEWLKEHKEENIAEDDSNEVFCSEVLKRFNKQRKEK